MSAGGAGLQPGVDAARAPAPPPAGAAGATERRAGVAPQRLVVGHLHLPSGELSAAILQCVLERLGHHVTLMEGTSGQLLARLMAGEAHLVSSAAVQIADDGCEQLERETVEVAALSGGHRFVWSIPDTEEMRGVRTIADLAAAPVRREVAAVQGGPGARQSRRALAAYGLEAAGFRMREDTFAHWSTLCRAAAEGGESPVIAHPTHHLLPGECRFRALDDPLGALGGEFRTAFVARRDVADALPQRTRAVLGRIEPGAEALTTLEAQMRLQHAAPRALVRDWLEAHPQVWADWLGPDARTRSA